ncbi:hypothetical protein LCGC14_2060940 [marine sediment metagenome]|uniref:Uncharacterized protein n=1 Tax=marine sediment metagenome TaxID=412755 RepID=A0A0F9ELD8_9ZZZZ
MITKIYYSIHNAGDGSVYLKLMESEKLAELDQEFHNNDNGWAEDCSGWITIESEKSICIKDEVETVLDQIKYLEEDLEEDYHNEDDRIDMNRKLTAFRALLKT